MKTYILDACALIAVLNKEKGAESVKEILEKARNNTVKIYMNKVNLLEVYYGILREYGEETADNIISEVYCSPVKIIDKLSDKVFKHAGILKSKYKISLADSIALAESINKKGELIT